jgi:hypothetical protein
MTKLKPKFIIAGSNKKKRGFGSTVGYFLTLILVFVVGVYVGMKIDDTKFGNERLAEISNDSSPAGENTVNKNPELVGEVAIYIESDSEIDNILSDSATIKENDIIKTQTAGTYSDQSPLEENENPLDVQQLQDNGNSESYGTKVALKNKVSDIAETESQGSGLAEVDIYRLQVAAFENLDDAKEAVKELQLKGYDAYIITSTNSRGEIWNLIKVGKFKTAQEAWNFSTLYKSKEGRGIFVESLNRGRVYNEFLAEDNAEE